MNSARCLSALTLLCYLSGCYTTRLQPTLSAGAVLPQNNGYFGYVKADTLPGVPMPEIARVARIWITEHSQQNAFEWQPPVYKAEQLYAGQLRPEAIPVPS